MHTLIEQAQTEAAQRKEHYKSLLTNAQPQIAEAISKLRELVESAEFNGENPERYGFLKLRTRTKEVRNKARLEVLKNEDQLIDTIEVLIPTFSCNQTKPEYAYAIRARISCSENGNTFTVKEAWIGSFLDGLAIQKTNDVAPQELPLHVAKLLLEFKHFVKS